jgi:uroporphyrin-III C-methyltransferase / precorrin-2 dehydrogenase / sirohydrochlorin ferrochelatase
MSGFVSLVGAGPGDPELLTVRAVNRLREADLVLYDALVSPDSVAIAARAQRFSVGKRAARPSMSQETIHRLMIRGARLGKRVVRLKGGDPFVFGRGGEEALALAAAGIPFEVVSGVTSAVAAAALAGIPVTHRGLASGFVVVSGHAPAAWTPALDSLPPSALTLVVLMGLASRRAIAARLLARGWPADTPAAILLAASGADASRWTGSLGSLGDAPLPAEGNPGTIVIGAVVALAAVIGACINTETSAHRASEAR